MDAVAGSVIVGLRDDLRDRARLVMNHAPGAADASEMVGGGERRPIDDLDAEHAPAVAVDDGMRFGAGNMRSAGVFKDVLPASDDGGSPDQRRPAGVDTGDVVIIRPEAGEYRDIPAAKAA